MTTSERTGTSPLSPLEQFPILDAGLYFNHAAVGPWPRCTAEAVQSFAEENLRQGSAGYRQWYARENALRVRLQEMTGAASADDIALLKNTTEGICTVAFGLDWQAGDNVVLPLDEFPSNRLPWLAQAARGVEIREVDIRTAKNAETALVSAMDSRTRLLAVSSVQWSDGFRLDLHRLGNACKKRDVLFFVDAIQQLGALPLDVEACHVDFLAADAHKWLLAPEGIAVFFCRDSARPRLRLLQQGWHMFDYPWEFERDEWEPACNARRFEAGSPNTVGQAALHASAGLLLEFGIQHVGDRILANTESLLKILRELPGMVLTSSTDPHRQSGIVSFRHEHMAVSGIHRELTMAGVSSVIRGSSIRLSPHFYQGEKQLGDFAEILERILKNAE
jgi:selenocysteine lyase/cysteine desulfurase